MTGLVGRLWVGGTTLLIVFIAYTSQLFVILPVLQWRIFALDTWTLLGPFNVLVGFVFWNYWLCVKTDPGGVPKGWEPPAGATDDGTVEVKKLTGGPRYCRTCKAFKPPRTHHCRQCKRCILKMDHHCPWVNNCVGYHNYGHFIRFLFSVDVACTYHIWMISKRAFGEYAYGPEPSSSELIFLILNYASCLPVILCVGIFSIYHFWCLLSNTTTIEGWEKDKAATLRRRGRIQEFKFPYSLGALDNLRSVLGASLLFWCWPQKMSGDGLSFPTSSDVGQWETAVGGRTSGGNADGPYRDEEAAKWAQANIGVGEGRRRLERADEEVEEMQDLV